MGSIPALGVPSSLLDLECSLDNQKASTTGSLGHPPDQGLQGPGPCGCWFLDSSWSQERQHSPPRGPEEGAIPAMSLAACLLPLGRIFSQFPQESAECPRRLQGFLGAVASRSPSHRRLQVAVLSHCPVCLLCRGTAQWGSAVLGSVHLHQCPGPGKGSG